MPGRNLRYFSFALVILLALVTTVIAEDFPGGQISVRPYHSSERGQHPTVVVQTVPGASTTATCLAIRYREPGKKGPSTGTAHLWEHLMFRTSPDGKPGDLLLRNELLGGQSKAWVSPQEVVLMEEVPGELGLQSLGLQIKRLRRVPNDSEGLKLEREAIRGEIRLARTPEENGRRELLRRLGVPSSPEGSWDDVKSAEKPQFESLLEQVNPEQDVVIAIVGPHTAREVRQYLAKGLQPLACRRVEPREKESKVESPLDQLEVESARGFDQASRFIKTDFTDPQVLRVAAGLLKMTTPTAQFKFERESANLIRLDLRPSDTSLKESQRKLSQPEQDELFRQLSRQWLDEFESVRIRAEMLAVCKLRGEPWDRPLTRAEFGDALGKARQLLKESQKPLATLTLKPIQGSKSEALFPFKMIANRSEPEIESEKLPNRLGVTTQTWSPWPTVAISGFFKLSKGLDPIRLSQLQDVLNRQPGGLLEYEVKPNGVFFHAWAQSSELESLLKDSAKELKALAERKDLLEGSRPAKPGLIESFFLPSKTPSELRALKGKRVFNPQNAHLVVVGDIDKEAMDRGLRPEWSGWFGPNLPPALTPKTSGSGNDSTLPKTKIVPIKSNGTPILLLGVWGPSRSAPNFLAFNLAIQTLAGRPATSLLARRLKNSESEVNSVKLLPLGASIGNGRQLWIIALRLNQRAENVEPLVTKVETLLGSLGRSPLPKSELDRTRKFLKSSLTLSGSTIRGRARVLAHSEFYRLSRSYITDFAGLYDNLTPSLVQAVCKQVLTDSKLRWVYLKPKQE